MLDPDRALDFVHYVTERHRVWEARQEGLSQPWTADPIIRTRKFTSVFRVLDPGSQYVLTDLCDLGDDPADNLMRMFLYRHTGRTETWDYLREQLGRMPRRYDLDEVLAAWRTYRVKTGKPLFTGAYLVYPQSHTPGTDKVESIVDLTRRLFWAGTVAEDFLAARTQAERFSVLRRNRGVADFMSMQILTDWGYLADEDREDKFIVPGPGAKRGAKILDPDSDPVNTIGWAYTAVRSLPEPPAIALPDGRNRLPTLIDLQNCLCEYSKYARYQGKPVPGRPYRPAHPGPQPPPVLPKCW